MPSTIPAIPIAGPSSSRRSSGSRTSPRRRAVEGQPIEVKAPIVRMSKSEIVRRGHELGVDFAATVSCYNADAQGRACGRCDSCRFRREGFAAAGLADPTRYRR
jgi:Predicted PP-loop superfamily ATPase